MKLQIDDIALIPGVDFVVEPMSPSLSGEYSVKVANKEDFVFDQSVINTAKSIDNKVLIIDESNISITDKNSLKKINDAAAFLKYYSELQSKATIAYSPRDTLKWGSFPSQLKRPVFRVKKNIDLKKIQKVKIDINAKVETYKTQNITGYIEGTEKPDSLLVIIGHYDHLGMMGSETYFPGAQDNASGIALMLCLAKHFATNPHKYSVVLIACSAEEIGLIGSTYFTKHPLFKLSKISFLINLDMVGTGEDGILVGNGTIFKDEYTLLNKINDEKKYVSSIKTKEPTMNSDHWPFYEKKVPCFHIATTGGTQPYHDINDKYETLSFTAFTNSYKLIVDFLCRK